MTNWKQKLHIEPSQGWLNGPNGLCWYAGKYHVYFQYAPDSAEGGGRKCWAHMESEDMLSWEYTGIVMEPDIPEDKNGVYSGCAFVDDGKLHFFYTGNVKNPGDYDYINEGREANQIHVVTQDARVLQMKKVIIHYHQDKLNQKSLNQKIKKVSLHLMNIRVNQITII